MCGATGSCNGIGSVSPCRFCLAATPLDRRDSNRGRGDYLVAARPYRHVRGLVVWGLGVWSDPTRHADKECSPRTRRHGRRGGALSSADATTRCHLFGGRRTRAVSCGHFSTLEDSTLKSTGSQTLHTQSNGRDGGNCRLLCWSYTEYVALSHACFSRTGPYSLFAPLRSTSRAPRTVCLVC